jgi:thiol-disulfide isomerase/thioredoxin
MTRHRRINTPKLVALFAALALIAAACGSSSEGTITLGDGGISVDSDATDETIASADSEGTSSEFTYTTADGQTLQFSDLSDGPVVINFFASWCPSCIAEMPDFEAVHQQFGTEVEFLGLAMQDRTESAVELVAETGVTYPFGLDPDGDVFAQFRGLGMPTTVFVAADGTVERVHSGQLDADGLAQIINDDLLS